MEEYWNCRNYTVESNIGEYPGVFIILTILMIIGTFLYWVLRCYFNSIEDHRMNINIFLNKRITEIILATLWTICLSNMWSSVVGPIPLLLCKIIRYSTILDLFLIGNIFVFISIFRIFIVYKYDWIMEFDQMKMEQRFVGLASLLGVLVYPGFLWVDIKRGTVHILESFQSRCSPTEDQDYVALANAIIISSLSSYSQTLSSELCFETRSKIISRTLD
ncbi:uncharacterized protein LOC111713375 [Eurytemora carolleeae]|uniref:uncharacterized protein LOC111713375 n=1 Tax=Eurytemora carolleeae TaxID=1294199 RepID=UPI000C793BB3|nr:uncharacterized protein LOC111713375 [Eurytemora carolleeae]|eukprot:XP_023343991.1 uncharacterized protein LOC111713375 [Eurytemora affinis]